jgi:hypothetical protein
MLNSEPSYNSEELPLGVRFYIAKLVGGNALASRMFDKSDNSVNLLQQLLSITSDASRHQSLISLSKSLFQRIRNYFLSPEGMDEHHKLLKAPIQHTLQKSSSRDSIPGRSSKMSEFKTTDELTKVSVANLANYMYILKNLAESVNTHKLLLPLNMPDTLVIGFDLPHPLLIYTLKGNLTFQYVSINEIENTVNWLYSRVEDGDLNDPIFIARIRKNIRNSTLTKKLQIATSSLEDRLYWKQDKAKIHEDIGWIGANTDFYSIYLARYILPKGMCASIIRSEWSADSVNEKVNLISSKARIDGEADYNPNKSVMHYVSPSRTATNNLKGSSFYIEDKYDLVQFGRQPFTPFINKDIQSKVSKSPTHKKENSFKLEIMQAFIESLEFAHKNDIPNNFEEDGTKIIQFLSNLWNYEKEEESKTSEDEAEEAKVNKSFSNQISSFNTHKRASSLLDLNNRQQFYKRQARKKFYIVDTLNKCNVYTRKAVDSYPQLKDSFRIIKEVISRYVFRPKLMDISDITVDFIEARNGKCYIISIKHLVTVELPSKKARKNKRAKNISIFQKGGGAERRKDIVCCGDYCKLIRKADSAIKEKLQLLMRFNLKVSHTLLELMVINDSFKHSFEDPTLGLLNRCETGLLKKNFQYKIMRKTILEDRSDPNSLPSIIKELPNEIMSLLSEEEHKDIVEIKNYMKPIDSKKHKDYKSKGLMWEFEIVPVCAICYKIYSDRQKVQKQKRLEAKREEMGKHLSKRISQKNLHHLRRLLGLDNTLPSITPSKSFADPEELELDPPSPSPQSRLRASKKDFVSLSEADFFKNRFFVDKSRNLSMKGGSLKML